MRTFAPLTSPPSGSAALPHRSARRILRRGLDGIEHVERRPLDGIARVGYIAHGVVYLLVGALATRVAFLHHGNTAGPRQAAGEAKHLFGGGSLDTILLGALAVGLLAYAVWRLAQGALDPDGELAQKKHPTFARIGRAGVGILYLGIAFTTAKLALGSASTSEVRHHENAPEWTARALNAPFGAVLVALVGNGVIAAGVLRARRAKKATFLKELDLSHLDDKKRRVVVALGRAGYAARAIVFAIIGAFLVVAAVQHDPSEARGLGGALRALAQQSWGPALLGVVALGLLAFGAFEIARGVTKRTTPA
jgi:hypothetical protein